MASAGVSRFSTSIHITALDGIVNVNSLFSLAVFIGLAYPTDPNNSLADDQSACVPGASIVEDLVSFHIYSFSSFLFSSLIALGLKQAIRIANNSSPGHRSVFTFDLAHINKNALRVGYLVTAAGSVCGCGFLVVAMVNVVQIKLGRFGCDYHTFAAAAALWTLVPVGILIYICFVLYAFTR